jgi:hypothetical protein
VISLFFYTIAGQQNPERFATRNLVSAARNGKASGCGKLVAGLAGGAFEHRTLLAPGERDIGIEQMGKAKAGGLLALEDRAG